MKALLFCFSYIRGKFFILLFDNQSNEKRPMGSWFASLCKRPAYDKKSKILIQFDKTVQLSIVHNSVIHRPQVTVLIKSKFLKPLTSLKDVAYFWSWWFGNWFRQVSKFSMGKEFKLPVSFFVYPNHWKRGIRTIIFVFRFPTTVKREFQLLFSLFLPHNFGHQNSN